MADDSEQLGERAAAEAEIRALTSDPAAATTAAIRLYGSELLAFLRSLAHDDTLANEAFAELAEDVWRGIAAFRWQSSLRSWMYQVARNALGQLRRDPRRKVDRNLPLSLAPEIALVERTVTKEFMRTSVKDGFRLLREQLDPEDHELLLLRLDRELSWKEIARILGGDTDLDTRAAALRKRFERAKERLRKLAVEHGLIKG